jgi:glycosyltransferase involved in cell wall biosynthesis
MKICLLTPEFLPEWGGVGTYTYNLATGLRGRAEVHVLTAHANASERGEVDGIRVHSLFPHAPPSQQVSPFRFQLAVFRHLPRLAREYGWDVIHANHAYMSDLFARMRRTRASSVLTVHTTLDTQTYGTRRAGGDEPRERTEAKVARLRFALMPIERRYLRKTRSMIFVSRWVRDRMLSEYGIAPPWLSDVIPNAIDTDLFSPRPPPEPHEAPTLLYAGRLMALKGVGTLIRAMTNLPPEVRVLLAGPGDPEPWRQYARRFGLSEDRCQFLGRVPYPRMPDLLRRVDAFVLPSFSESYPMAALEAMACGTPLIAASSGGIPEIVHDGETGWLFPPGDTTALAGCVQEVLAGGPGPRAIVARARGWIEENASIERMANRTYGFYERVLGTAS